MYSYARAENIYLLPKEEISIPIYMAYTQIKYTRIPKLFISQSIVLNNKVTSL